MMIPTDTLIIRETAMKRPAAHIDRRAFLGKTAGLAVSSLAFPAVVPASAAGRGEETPPSERITLGFIGTGGQGNFLLGNFLRKKDAQVAAVCDVHAERRERALSRSTEAYAERFGAGNYQGIETYNDFRDVLARADIDAVVIATPDNWHGLMGVMAADAGKDIYGEKPMALTVEESRAIVEAVRRNGRIFQTGSHRRSIDRFRIGCELVRNGVIGELHTINSSVPSGWGCDPQPEAPVPEGFDYDMWLGPAPRAPYTELRWKPRPSFILDYGNGMITDLGTHFNDIAQWGHGTERTGPVSVDGRGEYPKTGLYDTVLHLRVEYEFADGVRMICVDKHPKPRISARFEGTEGWIDIGYNETTADPPSLLSTVLPPGAERLYRSRDHHQNFLDCVKSRKETAAPPEVGHRSFSLCNIANISMLLGRKLRWDPDAERFIGGDEANRMLSRPMRPPWRLPAHSVS